jgi:hypothetical protein
MSVLLKMFLAAAPGLGVSSSSSKQAAKYGSLSGGWREEPEDAKIKVLVSQRHTVTQLMFLSLSL